MPDFTLKIYRTVLQQLSAFPCLTFADFIMSVPDTGLVLRHDVDKRPQLSLAFARLQHELGVRGTYYFRIVKGSFAPKIMEQIAGMDGLRLFPICTFAKFYLDLCVLKEGQDAI